MTHMTPHLTQNLRRRFAHTRQFHLARLLSGNKKQGISYHRLTLKIDKETATQLEHMVHFGAGLTLATKSRCS